jgi:S-adenosylmethionine-diacylgycerolhomoserine-N-methlytransferase
MSIQNTAASTEAMNRIYRRQRHFYDPTRRFFLLGRDDLIDRLDPPRGGTVLEIGCGTGRNLIVASQKYRNARFFGFDVSTAMLTSAHSAIARTGVSGRVRIAHADAAAFDPMLAFGIRQYDRVFIAYSLSMIPSWRAVLDRAIALVAPGGVLLVVDFGSQERLPAFFKRLLRRWLALFGVAPRDDLARALALAARNTADVTIERPYRGYAQIAVVRKRSAICE